MCGSGSLLGDRMSYPYEIDVVFGSEAFSSGVPSRVIDCSGGDAPVPPEPPDPPVPPEPEGINSYINSSKQDTPLEPNTPYPLYDSEGNLFSFSYKQSVQIVGAYDQEDNPLSFDSLQVNSLHDGSLWRIMVSTNEEGVVVSRVKITMDRVLRDSIVFGGTFTSTTDHSWVITDIFTPMSLDS